jgi:hypothetical protein
MAAEASAAAVAGLPMLAISGAQAGIRKKLRCNYRPPSKPE